MMRTEPTLPSRVLDYIDAHGGLERWRAVKELTLTVSSGGRAFSARHQGKAIRNLQAHVSPHGQRTEFVPYPTAGQSGIFEQGSVRIESDGHGVVAQRSDPRAAFRGIRHRLWWDKLDMLYFCGYALWTYLTIPFILTEPGFEVRELEPWEEGDETWQRIGVTFPSEIHTHCREQTLYFDEQGLLRRHDYTAEVFAGWARAAHYCFNYQNFDGLVVPIRRKVHPRRGNNRPLTAVTLVWIEIDGVRALPKT